MFFLASKQWENILRQVVFWNNQFRHSPSGKIRLWYCGLKPSEWWNMTDVSQCTRKCFCFKHYTWSWIQSQLQYFSYSRADIKHLLCPLSFTANTVNFPNESAHLYSFFNWLLILSSNWDCRIKVTDLIVCSEFRMIPWSELSLTNCINKCKTTKKKSNSQLCKMS